MFQLPEKGLFQNLHFFECTFLCVGRATVEKQTKTAARGN